MIPDDRPLAPGDRQPLNRRLALFDSDCLELAAAAPARRSRELPAFAIRERVYPLADKLERLYAFARRRELTMVFTHCCSARAVAPAAAANAPDPTPDGVLVVPMNGGDESWLAGVRSHRLINLEKYNDTPLQESFICRHFDAFQHNANARRLLAALAIPQWVMFGHGFDLCVDSAVKGLIAAGYHVHLLTDVIASSATGYGPYGTEASKRAILDYLVRIGVTTGTLESLLREHDRAG